LPGRAIFVTVSAFNFLGDGLQDALDPRAVEPGCGIPANLPTASRR
jgi:hypothetical protein